MKILFIGGSLNQTSMMHKISRHLRGHACYFSPYYADGFIHYLTRVGLLKNTILGGRHYRDTTEYLQDKNLTSTYGVFDVGWQYFFTAMSVLNRGLRTGIEKS
jgi:hypothetical protein